MVEQQFKKSTAEIPGIETRKVSRVQLFFTFHIISHAIVDVIVIVSDGTLCQLCRIVRKNNKRFRETGCSNKWLLDWADLRRIDTSLKWFQFL